MNIKDYKFEGHWNDLQTTKPVNAQRVILTDGDSIIMGSLTIDNDVINWLFDKTDIVGYNPIAWMESPNHIVVRNKVPVPITEN